MIESLPAAIESGLRLPCALCGVILHQAADGQLDEFTWVDDGGGRLGTDSDLLPLEAHGGAYAHLAWLASECARLGDLARSGKHGLHWPDPGMAAEYDARIREYASLKTRLDLGTTFHQHRVRASEVPAYAGPVPECCGQPAWLRPSGWQCRECKQPVAG